MTTFSAPSDRTRRRLIWGVPLVVAAMVAAAAFVINTSASAASPTLPARTPRQLLIDVQQSSVRSFSGDVTETANLGLPSLPGGSDSASLSWQGFVAGSHSARVWVDGPAKQRVALLGELSEADVVHNGRDVWTYTSDTNTLTHETVPARSARSGSGSVALDLTPPAVAARILKAIGPSTAVAVGSTAVVAGRNAYSLELRPRDQRSTVRRVTIAIDATKYIPLQVEIFGSGSSPALKIGFTSVSYTTPAASTFAFHPPKGATISDDPLGTSSRAGERRFGHRDGRTTPVNPANGSAGRSGHSSGAAKVIGAGWTSVLEVPGGLGSVLGNSTLRDLTTGVGTSGDRLLHTALINAVVLPDGTTFVAAVTPALLEHVAATAG